MIPLHKQSDQPLLKKESLAQQTLQTHKSAWKRCQFPRKKSDSDKIQILTKSLSKTPIATKGPAHLFSRSC
jgi:hypothetical protein